MTDEATDPRVLERNVQRALRRFFVATTVALIITVAVAGAVLAWLVLRVQQDFDDLQRARASEHACVIAKQEAFRRDVAALLTDHKPIPAADNVSCIIKRQP